MSRSPFKPPHFHQKCLNSCIYSSGTIQTYPRQYNISRCRETQHTARELQVCGAVLPLSLTTQAQRTLNQNERRSYNKWDLDSTMGFKNDKNKFFIYKFLPFCLLYSLFRNGGNRHKAGTAQLLLHIKFIPPHCREDNLLSRSRFYAMLIHEQS